MGRYKNNKDGTLDLIAGIGDTSALANKSDVVELQLTGTTNTSGGTITAGTWFYLNDKLVKAKVDIASNATFTKGTNYEEKTVGSALSELNSNISDKGLFHSSISFGDALLSVDAIYGVNVFSAMGRALDAKVQDNTPSGAYAFGTDVGGNLTILHSYGGNIHWVGGLAVAYGGGMFRYFGNDNQGWTVEFYMIPQV